MTDPITLDLAGIRARAEACGKMPWKRHVRSVAMWNERGPICDVAKCLDTHVADYIAGMDPPTTLALVDEVERLDHECQHSMATIAGERARADEADRRHEETGRRLGDTIDKMLTRAEAAEAEAAKLRARVAELESKLEQIKDDAFGDRNEA